MDEETQTFEDWFCDDEPETRITCYALALIVEEGNEYVESSPPNAEEAALN
jgi:hypothetical protein